MGRPDGLASAAMPASTPRYELRVQTHAAADTEYAIWQLPTPATPHVSAPVRIAGLRGRNLDLIEHRVLRRLARVRAVIDIKLPTASRRSPSSTVSRAWHTAR